MHVIDNFGIHVPKIIEKELGLTNLLQKQNGTFL